jgi:hypothetical protein
MTVLHRQGFSRVTDVHRCVIEPGGGFYIQGKEPPTADRQHTELLAKLDELSQQVAELRKAG